jgi:translation initiation factor IF-2
LCELLRKLRVYELGRHYGVDSKQIMALLQKMKVEAKSHMSVIEDEDVDKVHAVFQRKRELARENYARSHGLNPDQLKNVAALKPLEKPVPSDEPEPEVKVTKKKVTKKKVVAKQKVLVIKKAGQATAVSKKAQAEKDAQEQARQAEIDRRKEDERKREAELAQKREEHAAERQVKARLVKKVDLPKVEEPVAAPVPVPEPEAPVVEPVEVAIETAEAPVAEAPVEGTPADAAPADAAPAAPAPTAAPAGTPVAAHPLDRLGTKKNDGFKLGDIVRAAPPVRAASGTAPGGTTTSGGAAGAAGAAGSVSSETVRDSIKAAIQRRRDEADARELNARTKRARKKKKKVDEAEVQRAVKQTMAALGAGAGKKKRRKGGETEDDEPVEITLLKLTEFITVQELADKLQVKSQELIGKLFSVGIMATINQRLEKTSIELLASEYDREVEFLSEYGEEVLEVAEVKEEDLVDRPPVVTVMGHVDHGKTSLLDRIRHTNVIAGEAGGITQHIGAYTVATEKGPITFLDTPGHAAFTAMRARGAQVTDIVILIVAADDRVMPQTVEAISHAKAAGVPMIVAINKIDLPGARPDLVKHELLQHGIAVEEFGGATMIAEISAKKGIGIENLLDLIHLQAEVLELKASPKGPARGIVIEAKKEQGRGVVFTVLVEHGTLKMGDNFLAGMVDGKVRALQDERGKTMKVVMPGEPCEVLGASACARGGRPFLRARIGARGPRAGVQAAQPAAPAEAGRSEAGHRPGQPGGPDDRRRPQGTADHHQGRRGRFGRSPGRPAHGAEHRRSADPHHAQGRGRGFGVGRAAGRERGRHDHRLPPASGRGDPGPGQAAQRDHRSLRHHLRGRRHAEEGHGRPARQHQARGLDRSRPGARRVPDPEGRLGGRLDGAGRRHQAQLARPPGAQRDRGLRGQGQLAEALQGRHQGSGHGLRVRHRARELLRHRGRRRARVLRD